MAKVTFLGGEAVGNIGFLTWPTGPSGNKKDIVFPLNKPVEVTDPHILKKIRGMADSGIFELEEDKNTGAGVGAKGGTSDDDEEESAGTLKHSPRARKIP